MAEFVDRIGGYKVRVATSDARGVADAGAALLARRGFRRMVAPADLDDAVLPRGCELVRDVGLAPEAIAGFDGVVTGCACAIAQTGTIVLDHGVGQGRRMLTLLPDYHLCIVPVDRLVGLVPEAVAAVAGALRAGRPLTFISGPSATSDIELSRVEGVHGPRTLDVILVTR